MRCYFFICIMLLNIIPLLGKSFMPALDRIRKKVEDAISDDKTKTLASFLKEKKPDMKSGVIIFHNTKDTKNIDIQMTFTWATQKDFANMLVAAYKRNQIEARNILIAKIQEQYKQEYCDVITFRQDIEKEMSLFNAMTIKDTAQQEQFDTLIAITFIARQVL